MKPSMLGLLIAAGAFGASTIYLAMQLNEERARTDQYLEESRALNARIAELERVRADFEALSLQPPGPQAAPVEARPATGVPATVVENVVNEADGPPEGFFRPGGPPERSEAQQRMMRNNIRSNLKRLYGDLGTKLGISQDDANRVIDLMADQQVMRMERMRELREAYPNDSRNALMERVNQQNLQEITALIGEHKVALYEQYQQSLPARQEVETLSRQLDGNDLGLSRDQRDRMITALTEERNRVPQPSLANSASREEYNAAMLEWQKDYQQRSATRARSILTGEQVKTYNEYQQWQTEMRQQAQQRRSARGDGPPPPGPRPPR